MTIGDGPPGRALDAGVVTAVGLVAGAAGAGRAGDGAADAADVPAEEVLAADPTAGVASAAAGGPPDGPTASASIQPFAPVRGS
jgi:hypothetical protein